jgi:hypothetical protein
MAYFNHAFRKTFLATGTSQSTSVTLLDGTVATTVTQGGVLETSGLPTYVLNSLSATAESGGNTYQSGYVGIFNSGNQLSASTQDLQGCCNVFIAGSAIYNNDKIGPFAGGYTETNKSKVINPKYVSRFYSADACEPQNEIVHVGSTYYTFGAGAVTPVGGVNAYSSAGGPATGLTPNLVNAQIVATGGTGTGAVFTVTTDGLGTVTSWSFANQGIGKGYTVGDVLTIPGDTSGTFEVTVAGIAATGFDPITGAGGVACCKEFLCGETYSLRLDIKGSPALRYLNHNAYLTVDAYTGCCPEGSIAPVAVNSTEVMIKWADAIINSPIVNPFVRIIVQDEAGVLWYAPGTSAADLATLGGDTWDNYPEGIAHVDGACAGLIIAGAYVDTKFGDCTFQLTDFYEKEPVKLYLSEVDYNGDPCTFDGICVVHECLATQANGLGETMVRDLILSESYRQNFLATDLRIREITQGNQLVSAINRSALYNALYLQHNVPRFNNPTGVFDNDQYLLQIIFPALPISDPGYGFAIELINDWLNGCGVCQLEAYGCDSSCDVPVEFPPLPVRKGKGDIPVKD